MTGAICAYCRKNVSDLSEQEQELHVAVCFDKKESME
jgi:hypothetical protein